MRRVILAFSLLAAGCTGSHPTTPSASNTVSSSASNAPSPEASPTPAVPAAGADSPAAASPQFTLSGPQDPLNCFSAPTSPMQWLLNVSDAGPSPLRFVALAHQDETPGCGGTIKNPRSRIVIGGTSDYAVHASGQTTFAFDPKMYSCGRVQVDVSLLNAAGDEKLLVGTVINYGTQCVPPPPLSCRQREVSSPPGLPATLLASGGTGEYRWSTPEAVPSDGTGSSLTTNYWRIGVYTATVTSGDQTATCQVGAVPLTSCNRCAMSLCQPYYQYVGINRAVTFTARVPPGASFGWTAPGGTPSSGSGTGNLDGTRTAFVSTFATPGFYEVTLQGVSGESTLEFGPPIATCTLSAVPPQYAP